MEAGSGGIAVGRICCKILIRNKIEVVSSAANCGFLTSCCSLLHANDSCCCLEAAAAALVLHNIIVLAGARRRRIHDLLQALECSAAIRSSWAAGAAAGPAAGGELDRRIHLITAAAVVVLAPGLHAAVGPRGGRDRMLP